MLVCAPTIVFSSRSCPPAELLGDEGSSPTAPPSICCPGCCCPWPDPPRPSYTSRPGIRFPDPDTPRPSRASSLTRPQGTSRTRGCDMDVAPRRGLVELFAQMQNGASSPLSAKLVKALNGGTCPLPVFVSKTTAPPCVLRPSGYGTHFPASMNLTFEHRQLQRQDFGPRQRSLCAVPCARRNAGHQSENATQRLGAMPSPLAWGPPRRGFGKPTARCPTTGQGQSSHILPDHVTRDGEWHPTRTAGAVDDGGRMCRRRSGCGWTTERNLKALVEGIGGPETTWKYDCQRREGRQTASVGRTFGIAIPPCPSPHVLLSRPPFPGSFAAGPGSAWFASPALPGQASCLQCRNVLPAERIGHQA